MSRIDQQRRQAAALGTEVRSRRAAVKRRIADGELDLVALVDSTGSSSSPWPVDAAAIAEEIPVGQLLRSVPGIGPATAGAILLDLRLHPHRPLGELGPEGRAELAAEIERT